MPFALAAALPDTRLLLPSPRHTHPPKLFLCRSKSTPNLPLKKVRDLMALSLKQPVRLAADAAAAAPKGLVQEVVRLKVRRRRRRGGPARSGV
jgi:hypothetical protein